MKRQPPHRSRRWLSPRIGGWTGLLAVLFLLGGLGWWQARGRADRSPIRAELSLQQTLGADGDGFAQVLGPRPIRLPDDLGPHRNYRVEWWYFTGNLESPSGRRFGYQLTFFRTGLAPGRPERPSRWATHHLYMAHFALTDAKTGRFLTAERLEREALDLAGARARPFAVWLDDWSVQGLRSDEEPFPMELSAVTDRFALRLRLQTRKPIVRHGRNGFSPKSPTPGNASYYFSFTRLETTGTVQVDGERWTVRGWSWMDREWGSSFLEPYQPGWDWFGLQLGNGEEIMVTQIRSADPGRPRTVFGTWVRRDGTAESIPSEGVSLRPLRWWKSPRDETRYPIAWEVTTQQPSARLRVAALVPNQEWIGTIRYWEGAVTVDGQREGQTVQGRGYLELTGYVAQQRSRSETIVGQLNARPDR